MEVQKTQNDAPPSEDDFGDYNDASYEGGEFVGDNPTSSYEEGDVTLDQIRDLYKKVKATHPADEKDLIKILEEAAALETHHQETESFEKYSEVLAKVEPSGEEGEFGGDLMGGGSDEEGGSQNPEPTRVENGTSFYEATTPRQDFEFIDKGDGSANEIKTDGNIILKTIDPVNDEAKIKSKGKYLIIEITHKDKETQKETTTTWKIDKKEAKSIHIGLDADQIKGSYKNTKGKLTVGFDSTSSYVANQDANDIANTVENGTSLIGYWDSNHWLNESNPAGGRLVGGSKYGVGFANYDKYGYSREAVGIYQADAEAVKEILPKLAQAIRSNDAEDWKDATRIISRWKTQDQYGGGSTNNRAHLLFDVLYGELGEDGLKTALKNGIIDPTFAQTLANDGLLARTDENTSMSESDYQHGGPAWTHQTVADWVMDYVGSAPLAESEESDEG